MNAPTAGQGVQPRFILGLTGRSGTNWMERTLRAHPLCCHSAMPCEGEDWYLFAARHLMSFAEDVARHAPLWREEPRLYEDMPPGGTPEEWAEQRRLALLRALGSQLMAFCRSDGRDAPFHLFKQPSIEGLEHSAQLFPGARAVVLVRDARAVAESAARSWQGEGIAEREQVARYWARSARRLRELVAAPPIPLLVVRYEQLVLEPVRKFAQVFRFFGIPLEGFDLEAAARPVVGSSESRRDGGGLVWKPTEPWEGFNPLGRAEGWSEEERRDFSALAGAELRWLGYPA